MHQVQHAGWYACVHRQLTQSRGGHGRQLTHFQYGSIAKRKAGRNLPRRRHEGHIPRRHQRTHAGGVKQRVVQMRVSRVGVAINPGTHFSKVVKVVSRSGDKLLTSLRNHLAAIVGFHQRNLRYMRCNQITQFANNLGALRRRHTRPFREGGLGGGYGGVDFKLAARCNLGQYFLRGGVDGFEVGV